MATATVEKLEIPICFATEVASLLAKILKGHPKRDNKQHQVIPVRVLVHMLCDLFGWPIQKHRDEVELAVLPILKTLFGEASIVRPNMSPKRKDPVSKCFPNSAVFARKSKNKKGGKAEYRPAFIFASLIDKNITKIAESHIEASVPKWRTLFTLVNDPIKTIADHCRTIDNGSSITARLKPLVKRKVREDSSVAVDTPRKRSKGESYSTSEIEAAVRLMSPDRVVLHRARGGV
eukprot:248233_1